MSSPPTHNIHEDPLSELRAALESHAFGIKSYNVLEGESFPTNEAERAVVAQAARDKDAEVGRRVRAVAEVTLLDPGAEVVRITLDLRGYTIEPTNPAKPLHIPQTTFESLDALLIALSPAYVEAMQAELVKRFEDGGGGEPRRWADHGDDVEEPAWID